MKKSLRVMMFAAVAAACCGFAGAGCATPVPEGDNSLVLMTEDHAVRNFTVKAGEPFKIQLESNPTTGYSWQMKPDAGFLTQTKHSFDTIKQEKDKPLAGAPCVEVFEYRPIRTGTTTLVGYYHRSWEKLNAAKAKQVVYRITVR